MTYVASLSAVPERFQESQPVRDMIERLSAAGRKNFHESATWEIALCAMVLRLEPKCQMTRLLESLPYDTSPLSEESFLNVFAHLGYFCRPVDGHVENVDERLLPGLFIAKDGSPYIILGQDDKGVYQFYNPTTAAITDMLPAFHRRGRFWIFQTYDENRTSLSKFMRQGSGHSWFRALLSRFKGTFVQVMTAGLVLNVIALSTPFFIMLVYDRVIGAGSLETLPMLAVGALMAIGFEWKLRRIRSDGLSWLSGRLDNIVGNRIFAHLIGLSPGLIEKASVAAQIARIKTFESVRDFFSGSVFLSLLEAPFVFLSVAAIAYVAGPLVFIPLIVVGIYIALFWFIRSRVKVHIRLAAKTSSARQQFAIETFEKLQSIRSQGLTDKWQEKFRHLSGREMSSHFELGWLGILSETLAHALTILTAVGTVGFGAHLIWTDQITTGALVATMILVWRVLTPFYSLCTMVPRLEQIRSSIQQVNTLMDLETEAEEAKSFSRLPRLRGAVSFDNVCFRHTDAADSVFTGLSFDALPGDMVAITGSNGTGKGSILRLIKAMYRAESGSVRIDGFDIRQLDAPDLRRQIAYVPASAHFFSGTIRENLMIANPMAAQDNIDEALRLADALEDIQTLPMGLDTKISSDDGHIITASLSSRLSLARGYLHPSSLLLIDELPSTLLTGKTGKNLKQYLGHVRGRRTVIMVTYREDYLKIADTIVCMRAGQTPLSGPAAQMFDRLNTNRENTP